jgi:hypothetical protein
MESLPAAGWGFGVGALTGAVTSYGVQYAQNNGNVDLGTVGWSAVTGGVAGALMTTKLGQQMGGLRAIGASTNVVNYLLTTPVSDWSGKGATAAAVSGAVGMMIGGKAPNPYMFLQPSAGLVDKKLIAQMVTPKVLIMGASGAVASSIDWPKAYETLDSKLNESVGLGNSKTQTMCPAK